MSGGTLWRRLRELVEEAKVSEQITPHGLRHSIATHLLEEGMKVERVRDFLGHQHLETTQLYTRIKTEKQ